MILKALVLSTSILTMTSMSVQAETVKIDIEEAKILACKAALKAQFYFETTCEDEFYSPTKINAESYLFTGLDSSGDCAIEVSINKLTGKALSKISCD